MIQTWTAVSEDRIGPLIEGPEGIAADCSRIIKDFVAANPEKQERTRGHDRRALRSTRSIARPHFSNISMAIQKTCQLCCCTRLSDTGLRGCRFMGVTQCRQ